MLLRFGLKWKEPFHKQYHNHLNDFQLNINEKLKKLNQTDFLFALILFIIIKHYY